MFSLKRTSWGINSLCNKKAIIISFLEGKKVAVGENYSSYTIIKKEFPLIDFILVKNTHEALKLLSAGKVEAVIDILPVIAHLISVNGYYNLKISGTSKHNVNISFMIRNDYKELLSVMNKYIVQLGLANTEKSVSNRQDSFDPYFDNGRKGWWQRSQRQHIKLFIDSLFGSENVNSFANIVKLFIKDFNPKIIIETLQVQPIVKSKFKQLQETGKEAEFFFMSNYKDIQSFENGNIEDARHWGDGYDFQINLNNKFLLAEVKGIRNKSGAIRMTQNEFYKAKEYKNDYYLVIISNLSKTPKMNVFENPLMKIEFNKKEIKSIQLNYHSNYMQWN